MSLPETSQAAVRRLEFLVSHRLAGRLAGEYRSAFRGAGLEFSELRPYQPGDDVRRLDWRATARMGSPHVRLFREERRLSLVLAADVSASCTPAKRRLLLEAAALLGMAAARNRDRVGLVAFSDRVEQLVAPAAGAGHVRRILCGLLDLSPRGTGTDLDILLEAVPPLCPRPALVVLLSDFHASLPLEGLRRLACRHDLLALVLRDRREERWPAAGLALLRDPETGEERLMDLSRGDREALARSWEKTDRSLAEALAAQGVEPAFLAAGASPLPTLLTLFRRRRARR